MAFWMTHLRVAETVMPYLGETSALHYYAGALAPDCGRTEQNPDGTPKYIPGRIVSHWIVKDEELDRHLIDFDGFYKAMMPKAETPEQKAFYWGYYVHLITDAMWGERVIRPRKESLKEPTPALVKEMKDDIYHADLAFYRAHPDYAPLAHIRSIERFPNRYLEYYNDTDMENQFRYMSEKLQNDAENDRAESLWLSEEELDEFVMFATAKCIQMVKQHLAEE